MHGMQSFPALGASPVRALAPARPLQSCRSGTDVSSRFGLRLRQLRRDHKLTQLRLSVEFGIDRTFISDVDLPPHA